MKCGDMNERVCVRACVCVCVLCAATAALKTCYNVLDFAWLGACFCFFRFSRPRIFFFFFFFVTLTATYIFVFPGREKANGEMASATATTATTSGSDRDFDVIIVGGGPAGSSAVSICTWLKKRVCVIDPRGTLWPAPTGAVSKIHRNCGMLFGDPHGKKRVPWSVVDDHLNTTLERVRRLPLPHEGATLRKHGSTDPGATAAAAAPLADLLPSTVTVLKGFGRLADTNTVEVHPSGASQGAPLQTVTADVILIASGSVPTHLPSIPFDGRYVYDSDNIATIGRTPHNVVVQGAGIIGVEYAFIMRQLGAEVGFSNTSNICT